jgi:glycerate-2-kinase
MECIALTTRNLGLINEQALRVIHDKPVVRSLLLSRANHAILIAHLVESVLLSRFRVSVVTCPDNTCLMIGTCGTQTPFKGTNIVVTQIGMLRQLQPISVVVSTHPCHDAAVLSQENRVVILAHFVL